MKSKSLVLVCGSMLLLAVGCGKKQTVCEGPSFTRDDFKKRVHLKVPTLIPLQETYNNPRAFFLIGDSLILANNQPHNGPMLELFSLNTKRCVMQFGKKGVGPGEFVACNANSYSSTSPEVYITDEGSNTFYTVDIEKTLEDGKLRIDSKFQYAPDIHMRTYICPLDKDRYVGYNMWYLSDSTYSNGVPEFSIYPTKTLSNQLAETATPFEKYRYFVGDVNGGNFIKLPNRTVWLTDFHQDKITIFNDSMQVMKTIIGPDRFALEYVEKKTNFPLPFISFSNDRTIESYQLATYTDKHVYVIYKGVNEKKSDTPTFKPVEVFKFDYDGNPITCYTLDRLVYQISVDRNEEYLYATARTSPDEPARLVRYSMKE